MTVNTDNALHVSTKSETFENHFAGAQIIEVIVNGAIIDAPIVTVDDNPLPMYQASSGNWYGYFVEKDNAMEAQDTGLFDFGMKAELNAYECPRTVGDKCTTDNFKFEFTESRDVISNAPGRPNIYAFSFTEGSDIDVELENGADTETVTLSYGTVKV